jgi:hypothetical protein
MPKGARNFGPQISVTIIIAIIIAIIIVDMIPFAHHNFK